MSNQVKFILKKLLFKLGFELQTGIVETQLQVSSTRYIKTLEIND